LFLNARALEFGDWNYPVITANEVSIDQRFLSHPGPIVSATQQDSAGAARARKVTKHSRTQNDHAGPQTTPGKSTGRSNKRPTGPDKQHSSSSTSTKSWPISSQLVDEVDNMKEAEQESAQTSGRAQPKEYEQYQAELSPDKSREGPGAGSNEFIALRDGDETHDEILVGNSLAYGAFNDERDAWSSPDAYTTSKK